MGEARRRDEAEEVERAEWAAEMVADAEAILQAAGVAAHLRFRTEKGEQVGTDEERDAYMLTLATIAAHRAAGADVAAAIESALEDDDEEEDAAAPPSRPPAPTRGPLELVKPPPRGPLDL